jgi:hypothetical protein
MLLTAPRHLMVAAGEVQKRPYQAGQPATHTGKIQYRQCKRGVWPPSNWDPAVAVRSGQLPEAEMELEFVHGFDGWVAGWVGFGGWLACGWLCGEAGGWMGLQQYLIHHNVAGLRNPVPSCAPSASTGTCPRAATVPTVTAWLQH